MKGWREQTNYNNYQCRQAKFEWLPDKVVFKPWLAAIICVISIDAALLWDNLFTVDDRYYKCYSDLHHVIHLFCHRKFVYLGLETGLNYFIILMGDVFNMVTN